MTARCRTTTLLWVLLGAAAPAAPTAPGEPAPLRRPVYIGGFFPKFDDPAYDLLPATVQTAIHHVNNLTGLLDGYELRLRWEWTDGGPAKALRLLHDFVYTEPRVIMTWGPVLSSEALVVNEVAARFNMVQVGLANSPALGVKDKYPLTLRVWEEEDEVIPARLAFMKAMGWGRCGLIFAETSFREHFDNLAEILRNAGIAVVAMETVHDVTQSQEQVKSLKRHDARIVFVGFYQEAAKYIFCQIVNNGLGGARYVWIVPGWYAAGWWLSATADVHGCTAQQLEDLLRYHLVFSGTQIISDVDSLDYHGFKPQRLGQEQREYLQWLRAQSLVDNNWATLAYAYDALFAAALSLNATALGLARASPPRSLAGLASVDGTVARRLLHNAQEIDVYGLTDHVVIGENSARDFTEYVNIEQSQGNGTYVKVGKYWVDNQSVTALPGHTFMWSGGVVPVDGKTEVERPISISASIQVAWYALSFLGASLALLFLVINIRYRKKRAIKLSSPMLNNLIVCGCLFLYATVFSFGADKSTVPDGIFIALCFTETTLLCVGISLAFGALFLKTYRLHLIWTSSMRQAKGVEISDSRLVAGVVGMVTLDVIIILLWAVLDTHSVRNAYLESKLDEADPHLELYKVPVYRECGSVHQTIFTGLIYGVKGLLMLAGVFLAWEIRRITIAELNDSQYIAMSVYVVALTAIISVPTLTAVTRNRDLFYSVQSLAIIGANTAVLCLVFVPKVALFFRTKGTELKLTYAKTSGDRTKSPGSTLNSGAGKTSSLIDTLMQKERELSALVGDLAAFTGRPSKVNVPA